MKIGVLGSGIVGQTLAAGWIKHGHEVVLGTRDASKLQEWASQHAGLRLSSPSEAAAFADAVLLAVRGSAASEALRGAGIEHLAGKPVIDACNPIADGPPVHGVLPFFLGPNTSLMEQLQTEFPSAHFVKAFNSVGAAQMVNPHYAAGRPTMFICGNDNGAKQTVSGLLDQLGWETADMGTVEAARAIEPLCILWCIPGFTRNEWTHAFKLLRQ
jgi:8-hydroxy-5-deazaflavin:NADPH oxidoreductase